MTLDEIIRYLNRIVTHEAHKANEVYRFSVNYGVRITDLRGIAKDYFPNGDVSLAIELSEIDSYETMFLSVLLEDPKKVTLERITELAVKAKESSVVDQALCDLIMKSGFKQKLITDWFHHPDLNLRYAFYTLYATHVRKSDLKEIDIEFSLKVLDKIKECIKNEDVYIQNAMNNLVVMAGLHVPDLVDKAYKVARYIGNIKPLRNTNDCNSQSAVVYLDRYIKDPKFSRVAKIRAQH